MVIMGFQSMKLKSVQKEEKLQISKWINEVSFYTVSRWEKKMEKLTNTLPS